MIAHGDIKFMANDRQSRIDGMGSTMQDAAEHLLNGIQSSLACGGTVFLWVWASPNQRDFVRAYWRIYECEQDPYLLLDEYIRSAARLMMFGPRHVRLDVDVTSTPVKLVKKGEAKPISPPPVLDEPTISDELRRAYHIRNNDFTDLKHFEMEAH